MMQGRVLAPDLIQQRVVHPGGALLCCADDPQLLFIGTTTSRNNAAFASAVEAACSLAQVECR